MFSHQLENSLSTKRYLTGDTVTEADIFLFVVLIRFDVGYYTLLKVSEIVIHDFTTIIPRAIVFLILVYGENVTNQYDPDKI